MGMDIYSCLFHYGSFLAASMKTMTALDSLLLEIKFRFRLLATPGVCNPGSIKFFFLSSPPRYTCSSFDDGAVVVLLLVEGPVVETAGQGDGEQACFFF